MFPLVISIHHSCLQFVATVADVWMRTCDGGLLRETARCIMHISILISKWDREWARVVIPNLIFNENCQKQRERHRLNYIGFQLHRIVIKEKLEPFWLRNLRNGKLNYPLPVCRDKYVSDLHLRKGKMKRALDACSLIMTVSNIICDRILGELIGNDAIHVLIQIGYTCWKSRVESPEHLIK